MSYTYLTYVQSRTALAARLYDTSKRHWLDAELGLYIVEALRVWNALTAFWINDYALSISPTDPFWFSTNVAGSPRVYSVTDANLITLSQYHLLEPPAGLATWTGTPMFQLSDLTAALNRRQDEILQLTAGNMSQLFPVAFTPGTSRISLADNILDVRRARFVPTGPFLSGPPPSPPPPQTLWRQDRFAFSAFIEGYGQLARVPQGFQLAEQLPLTLSMDSAYSAPAALDLLVVNASNAPTSPTPSILDIPDDWSWVLKYGMLGDLLGEESEAHDPTRAAYCLARYQEGIALMQSLPWVLSGQINGLPVGVESVMEKDQYDAVWDGSAGDGGYGGNGFGGGGFGGQPGAIGNGRQAIVVAGTDFLSLGLRPLIASYGLTLQLVGAAPVPVLDADFVQVSRDVLDAILDYAQHIAMFKDGGAEFMATVSLFDNFRKEASLNNQRIAQLASFDDVLKRQGRREEEVDPRYTANAG